MESLTDCTVKYTFGFGITTTTSYIESLTDCMVRYTGTTTITRYVASTMHNVVRSMESLTDYTVRYVVGF